MFNHVEVLSTLLCLYTVNLLVNRTIIGIIYVYEYMPVQNIKCDLCFCEVIVVLCEEIINDLVLT